MSPSNTLGFVVGLAIEAELLALAFARNAPGAAPRVVCAAASEDRAREGARRLLSEGAGALVSFGIAGGLDPSLKPGDLVLADEVVSPGRDPIAADPALRDQWRRAAEAAGLPCVGGRLLGAPRVLAGVADKEAWHRSSGALAVDMESYAVAGVAAGAGAPFVAVRAIADPAGRPLPRAVAENMGPDGRPRLGHVVLGLGRRPWEVTVLLRLRRDTGAALASLRRLAGGLGPAGLV
ncbi:MAG: hypothetical protein R3285_02525 [Kiloniellales bacterium]|nr:hypothetical protein [Kiloniellales bacterium]